MLNREEGREFVLLLAGETKKGPAFAVKKEKRRQGEARTFEKEWRAPLRGSRLRKKCPTRANCGERDEEKIKWKANSIFSLCGKKTASK